MVKKANPPPLNAKKPPPPPAPPKKIGPGNPFYSPVLVEARKEAEDKLKTYYPVDTASIPNTPYERSSADKKAEQVTGYSKKDVLGNSLGMFLPPEGIKDFFDKLHQAVSTGVVPKYELDVNTIYGRRNFEMGLTAIIHRDIVLGVDWIACDIT